MIPYGEGHYYYTHFTDKEIKAQRGCDLSRLGLKPKPSDSKAETLIALLIFTIRILLCSNANPWGRTPSFSGCWTLASVDAH